jgi:glutathione S-transferase
MDWEERMPMILYSADMSPYAARVRLQIRAKDLEREIKIVDRPDQNYLAITPTGKVPCLDTNQNFVLPESETICEFIEDLFPEPSLRGQTAIGKAKVRLIARLVDLYLMKAFVPLFGQFMVAPRDPGVIDRSMAELDRALDLIENYLEGPLYATHGRFTLADCALTPALFYCTVLKPAFGREPFEGHAKTAMYFNRLTAEDDHCAALIAEMADGLQAILRR